MSDSRIAIIGIGCRFPGQVHDAEGLWRLLRSGENAVARIPPSRWQIDPLDGGAAFAALLDDVSGFDADFFRISEQEAVEMDPAQRLLLEVAWEALEHAGVDPLSLKSTRTGVWVGLGLSDYGRRHFLGEDPTRLTPWSGTGSFLSVAAGRIAYFLGMNGPAVAVDTACSSSLVAVHQAVRSLRLGETDLALAGGANILLSGQVSRYFARLGALAPDGRCKPFDARADGYGRGEGAGVLVLKRLSEAVRDGDPVLAVIAGSALNHDGASNGLTAPSGRAQQQVIGDALKDAGIGPDDVGYVETHGTGTPLGDSIELGALRAVYGNAGHALGLGAVKANIGHTETAAGVAGVIAAIGALRHQEWPGIALLEQINPRARVDGTGIQLPTEPVPWPDTGRRAAVSSFGLSGTNAHVILEPAPRRPDREPSRPELQILTLTAHTESAVRALAGRWSSAFADPIGDAVASANTTRARLPHRASVVAESAEELTEGLRAIASGQTPVERAARRPTTVFLFTGQGAQYPGMGRALYDSEPVYRDAIDRCAALANPLLPRDLREVMWDEAGPLGQTAWTQPALFALEYALAELLRSWGVEPDAVAGHSIGEYVAACIAGVFTLEDAVRLVVARGRLMQSIDDDGAMLAARTDEALVVQAIGDRTDVVIAALNTPAETVISGARSSVLAVGAALEEAGVKTRELRVSHAFHSPQMDPILDDFEAEVAATVRSRPTLDLVANTTGAIETDRLLDARYWRDQLRNGVRWTDTMRTLAEEGHRLFIELGPRPVLSVAGERTLDLPDARWLPLLDGKSPDRRVLLEALGGAFRFGAAIDWATLHGPDVQRVRLPPIPFERKRYWLDLPGQSSAHAAALHELTWADATGPRAEPHPADVVWLVPADVSPADAAALVQEAASRLATLEEGGRLWVGTRGAFEAATPAALAHATLWGFAAAAALEHPERWGGLIDLPADAPDFADVPLLADEGVTLLREGRVRVGRLAPRPDAIGVPTHLDGTVLVTGAFGAIGRRIASWLAARGARRLVLVGRSGAATDQAQELLVRLRAVGVEATEVAADPSRPEDAARVIAAAGPNLTGVLCAAGVLDDALIRDLSAEQAHEVFAAKLIGAHNLHRELGGRELSFFAMLSSASATLGTVGQAAYGAANAGLDALARHRRNQGLAATSIAFGPWSGVGMASTVSRFADGVSPIDPDHAIDAVDRLLAGPLANAIYAPFDWQAFAAARAGSGRALLSDLAGASTVSPFLERLTVARDRSRILTERVAAELQDLLGHPVTEDHGFFDAGLDSLTAIELRNRLQQALGIPLSAAAPFDHPTIRALVEHLLEVSGLTDAAESLVEPDVASSEPIAIVGMAGRFPGAPDLEAFWRLLDAGIDAITQVPADRWDADAWYDPTPGSPGKMYVRTGGFLDRVDTFDAGLFGIPEDEALAMDPQQRLLLEASWEALEDAGLAPRGLTGSRTGVYVGIRRSDYDTEAIQINPPEGAAPYLLTGNDASFAPGRVSWTFGFRGPSVPVNTACSSSLVAVHLACQDLRAGTTNLALAGGVNLLLDPVATVQMCRIKALSPDGRCKAFDASADGYGRSEGCGVVVLKRLSDARRDGDRVLAVIEGSAVNHDGPSSGLTVPSGTAQRALIRDALLAAGRVPEDIDLLEAHGTGTPLGDPIELGAVGDVMRDRAEPLWVGSVKSNIGHLELAAGIAGLIKSVLALQHGRIPAHLHLQTPNPEIPTDLPIRFPRESVSWPRSDRRRRVGISSFGLSGTNAHLILSDPPEAAVSPPAAAERPRHVLRLSAQSEASLDALVTRYHSILADDGTSLPDLAWSSATGRSDQRHRVAISAANAAEARAALQTAERTRVPRGQAHRVAFLFTGQGVQRPGMAKALYEGHPTYRAAFDRCEAVILDEVGRSMLEVIDDPEALRSMALNMPALFALEWSLAELWESWGIVPHAVIGHSVGEVVAATRAGVLSLADGVKLVAARGRLMHGVPPVGGMAALFLPADVVRDRIAGTGLEIACFNGPEETVISGEREAVASVAHAVEAEGVRVRILEVPVPAHSALMEPILAEFHQVASTLDFRAPTIPVASNLTGQLERDALCSPDYWRRQVREPVRFTEGIRALAADGITAFVEVGPHPVLLGMAQRSLPELDGLWLPSLHREDPAWPTLLDSVAEGFRRGLAVDPVAFDAPWPRRRVAVPHTPFDRKRFWLGGKRAAQAAPILWRVDWRPIGPARADASPGPRRWLVVGPEAGLAADLTAALEVRGDLAQHRSATDGPSGWSDLREYDGIVFLDGDLRSLLALVQAAIRTEAEVPIHVATRGDPGLWGLMRTVRLEHPEIAGWLLELGPDPAPEDPFEIIGMLLDPTEDQVAIRDGRRFGARLVAAEADQVAPDLSGPGTFWLTGGLGGLGLWVAEWLVERGARSLVLTGRNPPHEQAEPRIAKLRESVSLQILTGDVAERADVDRILAEIQDLRGVIHLAGVLEDGAVENLSWESFERVARPKAAGARNLDDATRKRELDAFVLFSSITATTGTPGQGNYAAANAEMEAIAADRRAHGHSALCIGWGPWAGAGLAAELEQVMTRRGARMLTAEAGLTALGRLWGRDETLVVTDQDWDRYVEHHRLVGHPFFSEITRSRAAAGEVSAVRRPELVVQIEQTAASRRRGLLADAIAEEVARVMGRDPADPLDRSAGFFDLGMDSLMTIALRRRIQKRLDIAVPMQVAFDHPTIDRLTDYLLRELFGVTEARVVVHTGAIDEPIAVVGMACRFPGAPNIDALWELLASGRGVLADVPPDRWRIGDWYDESPGTPGRMYVHKAAFLDRIDTFDAELFGIAPGEAEAMDPAQRILLEVTWSALEDALIDPTSLEDSRTGVYVGLSASEYMPTTGEMPSWVGTGNDLSFAAGRLSYQLGLQGPSIALNTACSSSLVAIHLACKGLRSGEADLALAGGSRVILSPLTMVWMASMHALSPDGLCKAFDASADGFGRGEGAGVVVLKRLSDAQRDGDRIHAVIRGSATNHGGAASGLTVPSANAQIKLIHAALADAGIDPDEVGFIEAHGTGTRVGDPIEVGALNAVFGKRPAERELYLGSIKSNIGHLEVAAGVAGFIKAALAVERGEVPAHLHFEQPSPDIEWHPSVSVPTRLTAWEGRRVAGVSAFGIGGTNAHVVLEQAQVEPPVRLEHERPLHLLRLSAASAESLAAEASHWAAMLDRSADRLADLAHTVGVSRAALPHRLALVGVSRESIREQLLAGMGSRGVARREGWRRSAWLFGGQGTQRVGMGRALYEEHPVFREVMDRCDAVSRDVLPRPLLAALYDSTELGQGEGQAAIYAIEVALAAVWRSWGLVPDFTIGNSMGEYAAAAVAGVFSIEDGARLVAQRGVLMDRLMGSGHMAAVFAPEAEVITAIQDRPNLWLAGVGHRTQTVISGAGEAVDAFVAEMEAKGVRARIAGAPLPCHSGLMDPVLDELRELVANVPRSTPEIPVASTLTGRLERELLCDPGYWVDQLRHPMRMLEAFETLEGEGVSLFVDCSNHPTLAGVGRHALPESDALWLASMKRDSDEWETLFGAAADAWVEGVPVDAASFDAPWPMRRVPVPLTPFAPTRYWMEGAGPQAPVEPDPDIATVAWRPLPEAPAPTEGPQRWRIIADDQGFAAQLAAELESHGRTLTDDAPDAIVTLRALDATEDQAELACRELLALAQQDLAPIHIVTRGAMAVSGPATHPVQAAAWGLGRVLAMERPSVWGSVIDLDPHRALDAAEVFRALSDPTEDQVAFRGGQRLGARLTLDEVPKAGAPLDFSGTQLVTGGLGAVGLHTAKWLFDRGAEAIVLTSRSAPTPERQERIDALRERGARLVTIRGDVSDPAQLDGILEQIDRDLPALRGVFHLAGVLDDRLIDAIEWSAFDAVLAPKIRGAWNLHRATEGRELNHFVLFSSIAATLGSVGQASYASANAALSSMASWRRARKLPGLAVDWGAWAGSGMATGVQSTIHQKGVRMMRPEAAFAALEKAMRADREHVLITRSDWAEANAELCADRPRPFLAELLQTSAHEIDEVLPAIHQLLVGLPREAWLDVLRDYVTDRVREVMRTDRELDRHVPLWNIGMDSLTTVELRNALLKDGARLQVARMIGGPSIEEVATMVIAAVADDPRLTPLEAPAPTRAPEQPDEEEPPLDPVLSHLGAAFGGALAMAVAAFILWQLLSPVP